MMNSRITELAIQAGVTGYFAADTPLATPIPLTPKMEQFAELIVKDCVDQLTKEWYRINNLPPFENETSRDVGMRVGAKSEVLRMVAVLNKHFGINE